MPKAADAESRVNVRVDPIGKARALAVCEQRSVRGHKCTLTELVNNFFFSLPPLPDGLEQRLAQLKKPRPLGVGRSGPKGKLARSA